MADADPHIQGVLLAVRLRDETIGRKDIITELRAKYALSQRAACRWLREADTAIYERDCDLGSDVQTVRQRLMQRAWDRSTELHSKALDCLRVDDHLSIDGPCIVERGSRLAEKARAHEESIAGWMHIDRISPTYDLHDDQTRDIVSRAVVDHADAFDTPDLLKIVNAATEILNRRPYLHEEQHREAQVTDRIAALLAGQNDPPN